MQFEKNYFVNSKISNYKDYRKKKYADHCKDLINRLNIQETDTILDYGCATGALLYEFKRIGLDNIKGTDISIWAIEEGKKRYGLNRELEYYNVNLLTEKWDYVLFLDVLEHMPTFEINNILKILGENKPKRVVLRVPISKKEGEDYVLPVSRNDKTHIQCHSRKWWVNTFNKNGFKIDYDMHTKSLYSSPGVFVGVFK